MSQDPRPVGRGEQVPPHPGGLRGLGWAEATFPLWCPPPSTVHTASGPHSGSTRSSGGVPIRVQSGPIVGASCQQRPSRHTHQLPAHPTPEAHRAPNPARTPSTRTHAGSHLRPAEAPAPLDSAPAAPAATSPSGMWPELPDAHVISHTAACWEL